MDPEKLLKNLGFGFSVDSDISYGRIPDRFLLTPSSAGGIDLYKFVLHHPDLHHLLWMWDKKSEAQSVSGTSSQSSGKKTGQCTSQDILVEGSDSGRGVDEEKKNDTIQEMNVSEKCHETLFKDIDSPKDVRLKLIQSVPERYLEKTNESVLANSNKISSRVEETIGEEIDDEELGDKNKTKPLNDQKESGMTGVETIVSKAIKADINCDTHPDERNITPGEALQAQLLSGKTTGNIVEADNLNESETAELKSAESWSSSSNESDVLCHGAVRPSVRPSVPSVNILVRAITQ